MFKKISLFVIFQIILLNAATIPNSMENMIGSVNSNTAQMTEENSKKTYDELINGLSKSFDPSHAMYLATIYLNGISEPDIEGHIVKADINKSIKYFEKSINLNDFKSAAMLGSLYLFDSRFDTQKDRVKKAKYYLNLAVKNGIYEATTALASIYLYYEKNTNKGFETLYLGAKNNNSSAQLILATLYAYGSKDLNVSRNIILGNSFLEKACLNKKKTKKVEEFCSSDNVLNYKKNEVNKK